MTAPPPASPLSPLPASPSPATAAPAEPGLTSDERQAILDALDYQDWAARLAARQVMVRFGIPVPQLIWSKAGYGDMEPYPLLDAAVDAGRVNKDDAFAIKRADIVLRNDTEAGAGGCYLAEASITPDDSDILNARRRADLLAQAVAAPAQALVIGAQIPDSIRDLAATHNVAVCILPEKER